MKDKQRDNGSARSPHWTIPYLAIAISLCSLTVSGLSFYESYRNHITGERAYVDAMPPDQSEIVPAIKPVIWVHFINTGKTHAIGFRSKTAFISGAKSDEFAFNNIDQIPAGMTSIGILPPGQLLHQSAAPDKAYDELKVARIRSGTTLVHVIGRAEYSDIFGRPHRTDFCFRYSPGKPRMEICHVGNNVD
jgi:hypothetical protein